MPLTIKIIGANESIKYVENLNKKMDDWTPVYSAARRRYSSMVRDEFRAEGGMYGVRKWQSLSDIRQNIRNRANPKLKGKAHPILRWTDALKTAATSTKPGTWSDPQKTGKRPPTMISQIQDDTKTSMYSELIGPKIVLHEGGKIGRTRIPGRQFWPWTLEVHNEMVSVWGQYLDKLVK